jgi:hypothetical protein
MVREAFKGRATDEDERAVNIIITPLGEQRKEQAVKIPLKMAECMPLSKDDARVLYGLLYKILKTCEGENQNDAI